MEKSIQKKPMSKVSEKEFVKNTVELNPKLQEASGKTAVVSWGRMNPPTIGHEKLANKVVATAKANGGTPIIYLSHSQDAKKNPLSYEDKYMFARAAFGPMIQKSNAKTIIQVMQELEKKYSDVILVVGADRIVEFDTLLNKYNGKDFKLNSIKVVSAGERDPDAEGVEGMSASKMRAAAASGDDAAFKSGLPKKLQRLGQEVYDVVRLGMKIAEELEIEGLLNEAVLDLGQRRKRGLIMRRYKTKIMAARNRAKRKMAGTDALEIRARKAAINSIRKKVAGSKGADYANLSPSEKMMIDKRVAKRQKAIGRIARKLMPTVRKAERERFRSQNSNKNEEFEAVFGGEQKKQKTFHQLYNGDKTVKHDGRFKIYKQKKVTMEDTEYSDALALIEQVANDIYNNVQLDESKIKNALFEKSEKSGLPLTEISKAYSDGVNSWNESSAFDTPSQQGFANVGAVIAEKNTAKVMKAKNDAVEDVGLDERKAENKSKKRLYYGKLGAELVNKTRVKGKVGPDSSGAVKTGRRISESTEQVVEGNTFAEKTSTDQDPDIKDMKGTQPKVYFKGVAEAATPGNKSFEVHYTTSAGTDRVIKVNAASKKAAQDKVAGRNDFGSLHKIVEPKKTNEAAVNEDAETKESKHTKKYRQMHGENLEISEDATASLQKKADKSGMPLGILRQVYNRGMAAWKTGHRPGTTPEQWAHARVNSFVTKSSGTWGKADSDLAAKVRSEETEKPGLWANIRNRREKGLSKLKPGQDGYPKTLDIGEEGGAGEEGTNKLAKKYKKDTPNQSVNEAFENMLNEENECALITREDIRELEKFADSLLKDYGIDVEFTRHFGDRMSDERNTPCINVKELKDFFRKVYNNKGMKIKGNSGIEAILKDMQKNLNMPVVIDYRNGEVELTFKTIMRKKNFSSPNKVISY